MSRTSWIFLSGLATTLAWGWLAFPHIRYARSAQPADFRHQVHAQKSGSAQCSDCHALRQDGAFTGIPRTEACAACHAERMGTSPAEATLVDDYIKKGREMPWLVYGRQPANVWFSHAIHTKLAGLACADCHGQYGESNLVLVYARNRISGYTRTAKDMSMCEDCHRRRHVQVSCLGCHQ
jgi:menaquinone reductase, multiheme cytochrome c subunit